MPHESRSEVYPPRVTRFVGFYCVVLMVLYNLAAIGLISVPVQFLLINKFHLDATAVSRFGFLTDSPYFIAFAFGFLRDRWRPMGKGDVGYFFATPILMAVVYAVMASRYNSYPFILCGMIAVSALSALLGAAAQGLLAAIGKDFGMTGRLGAVVLLAARGSIDRSPIGFHPKNIEVPPPGLIVFSA